MTPRARRFGGRAAFALPIVGLFVGVAGCRPVASEAMRSAPDAAIQAPSSGAPNSPLATPLPPSKPARCRPGRAALTRDDVAGSGGAGSPIDIGDAVRYAGGFAVAMVRDAGGSRVACVALLGGDGGAPVRIVDLGPTLGDAPPPRIAARDGNLLAVAYRRADNDDRTAARQDVRQVALYALSSAAPAATFLSSVSERRDDSLALDLAISSSKSALSDILAIPPDAVPDGRVLGVVVWDEASSVGHGVVRAASLLGGGRIAHVRDLSPPEADAEQPRVVPTPTGFVVLWIARRADPLTPGDAGDIEVTGEARTAGWLESIALDEHAIPRGGVRRLSPPSGHVSAYDVLAQNASDAIILVVVRDDGEAVEGSGGTLFRVRIVGDAVEPPASYPTDGLGRGAPSLVDGDPPWLSWVGPREQPRLLPLDPAGVPTAAPSAEDAMTDARPLLSVRSPDAGSAALLVAAPSEPAALLRAFACTR